MQPAPESQTSRDSTHAERTSLYQLLSRGGKLAKTTPSVSGTPCTARQRPTLTENATAVALATGLFRSTHLKDDKAEVFSL